MLHPRYLDTASARVAGFYPRRARQQIRVGDEDLEQLNVRELLGIDEDALRAGARVGRAQKFWLRAFSCSSGRGRRERNARRRARVL